MMHVLKSAWADMLRPILKRSERIQVAALCYRLNDGKKEVLMITSRDTGRWILPKGWPIDGLDGPASALQEAWEEAGVRDARAETREIGTYLYDKGLADGTNVPVKTYVYKAEVLKMADRYPEVSERDRAWMAPKHAAQRVAEPELAAILNAF